MLNFSKVQYNSLAFVAGLKRSTDERSLPEIAQYYSPYYLTLNVFIASKKVQVGKDQEKAQSEKDSHSKNRGGKNQSGTYTMKTFRKPNEQLFSQ